MFPLRFSFGEGKLREDANIVILFYNLYLLPKQRAHSLRHSGVHLLKCSPYISAPGELHKQIIQPAVTRLAPIETKRVIRSRSEEVQLMGCVQSPMHQSQIPSPPRTPFPHTSAMLQPLCSPHAGSPSTNNLHMVPWLFQARAMCSHLTLSPVHVDLYAYVCAGNTWPAFFF